MYIVFDIGGTNTRFAVSRDGSTFDEQITIETPRMFEEATDRFKEITNKLAGGEKVEAIAGGIRGPLDKNRSTLLSEIYLTDWVGRPIKKTLSVVCGAPVYLENDTALVGLGEAVVGAGKGGRIVAYLTISTGVGGVRVVEEKLDEVSIGFEPGKQIIDPDNSLCPDCPGSTLENYVSGADVEKRFGIPPYEVLDEKIWHELGFFLGIGVHNIIVHWSPDIVVLGGPMIVGNPSIFIEDVAKYVSENLTVFPEIPNIITATLGDVGGLHGALAYLKQCTKATDAVYWHP